MKQSEEIAKEYFLHKTGMTFDSLPEFYKKQPQFTLEDVVKIMEDDSQVVIKRNDLERVIKFQRTK